MGVHATVCPAGDGRTGGVGDADCRGAFCLAITKRAHGVCSLSRLRYEETDIVPEDWWSTVHEIRGEEIIDGELGELPEQLPRGEGRIVRSPAANQEKPAAPLDLW